MSKFFNTYMLIHHRRENIEFSLSSFLQNAKRPVRVLKIYKNCWVCRISAHLASRDTDYLYSGLSVHGCLCKRKALEGRDNVSIQRQEEAFLVSNIIKITFPSGTKIGFISYLKGFVSLSPEFLSCNTTHCMCRCTLKLFTSPCGDWDSGHEKEKTPLFILLPLWWARVLCLWPRNSMSFFQYTENRDRQTCTFYSLMCFLCIFFIKYSSKVIIFPDFPSFSTENSTRKESPWFWKNQDIYSHHNTYEKFSFFFLFLLSSLFLPFPFLSLPLSSPLLSPSFSSLSLYFCILSFFHSMIIQLGL